MSGLGTSSPPPSRLHWLRGLVAERFSPELHLEVREGRYRLTLGGSSAWVDVDMDQFLFPAGSLDVGCGHWEGQAGIEMALPGPLPMPGLPDAPVPLIEADGDGARLRYDIFALAFWMMTRVEEIDRADLDLHGRFPATSSHAYRHGYLERPVVDEWFAILAQVLRKVWPQLPLSRRSFAVRVSHDVDSPSRYGFGSPLRLAKVMVGDIVKRHDIGSALRAPLIRQRCKTDIPASDPSNTFDWIMDVSDRLGLRSAFYFICGRTSREKDALYDPEHPAIRQLIRKIHARGHEVGLHPSYGTFLDPDAIVREADRLRRVCGEEGVRQAEMGGRMHFLRWRVGRTLQGWERAGMAYDSTLGYADLPGFRCGTCQDFDAYDPILERPIALRIRPLVAMECTVMAPRYLGLGIGQAAADRFMRLKEACAAVGGQFTLLWHNTELETGVARELYQGIIK